LYAASAQFTRLYFTKYICYNITKYQKKENILKRVTKSLLEELNSIAEKKNNEAIIEARAIHVIDSAINLLSLIKESFPPEEAYELERRMINSIKGGDSAKFTRSIRRLRDNKETLRHLTIVEGDVKNDD
jgi:hypothetical protein